MKQILLYFLCLLQFGTTAQTLTARRNTYRPGDKLIKQQIAYIEPGIDGKDILWNFSKVTPLNEKYHLLYLRLTKTDSIHFIGLEHDTRYRYTQTQDTLFLTGYDNRTTYMRFSKPEAQLRFPFQYGDSLVSHFEVEGIYCNKVKLVANGKTAAYADATGAIITPDNDTLKHVLRVKRIRNYTQIGVDSVTLDLITYSWYARGYRYPVFESVKSFTHKKDSTAMYFNTSFYYAIEHSKNLRTDKANEKQQEDPTDVAAVFTEAQLMPNPVTDNLYINYKLTRDARVWFTVHNNIGIPLCQTTSENQAEGYHTSTIRMNSLITGVYSLYVHVDDKVLRMNVIKK